MEIFTSTETIVCCRSLIFKTLKSAKSDGLSLKYQMCTSLGCKDRGILKTYGKNLVPLNLKCTSSIQKPMKSCWHWYQKTVWGCLLFAFFNEKKIQLF